MIDDSDDEASTARRSEGRKRKREMGEVAGGTIDLVEQELLERRRKRVAGPRGNTGLGQSEIIVIDD